MATATRAQRTQKPAAAPTRTKPVQDVDVLVTDEVAKAITDLRTARNEKSLAEKREKDAKEIIFANLPKQGKRKRFILRHGANILGKVSWRSRDGLDGDLLMQGWPEAAEACKTTSTFQVIN
jgi:hypothetical protein